MISIHRQFYNFKTNVASLCETFKFKYYIKVNKIIFWRGKTMKRIKNTILNILVLTLVIKADGIPNIFLYKKGGA